jgi:hypothetical protein
MSDFGELRSLLHEERDGGQWHEVCALLDTWPRDQLVDRVLPYVARAIEGWPAAARVAPARWVERWSQREEVPELALTRAVSVGGYRPHRLDALIYLGAWPGLERVTVVKPGPTLRDALGAGFVAELDTLAVTQTSRVGGRDVAALARRRDLGGLTSLSFTASELTEEATTELVKGGGLTGLRELELRSAGWSERALRALGDGALGRLESLRLSGWAWPRDAADLPGWWGVRALLDRGGVASALGRRLEELSLRQEGLGVPAAGERPLELGSLEGLTRLDLSRNPFDADTWAAMCAGGLPEGLVALNVGRTELSGEALAASLEGARVEDLDVVEAMIREQGARALGQCEALGRLRALKMGGGGLTEDGADAIVRGLGEDVEELSVWRTGLRGATLGALAGALGPRTRKLVLEGCMIGDGGVKALCGVELSGLEELNLSNCGLGDAALDALRASGSLEGVRRLNLSQGSFSLEALEALWTSGALASLRALSLAGCGLGPGEAVAMARAPELGRLSRLDLAFNPIGEEGRRALRTSTTLSDLARESYH